jgi:hypothetical protein
VAFFVVPLGAGLRLELVKTANRIVIRKLPELVAQGSSWAETWVRSRSAASAMCSSPSRSGERGANSSRSNWISGVA